MDSPRSRLSPLFVITFLLISISSSHSATTVLEGTAVKIADDDTNTVIEG